MTVDIEKLRAAISETQPPFALKKLGHVVIKVTNLERSLAFYAGVLGFKVSDIYGDDMMPGGMVFMRCNTDHHGVALIGGAAGPIVDHDGLICGARDTVEHHAGDDIGGAARHEGRGFVEHVVEELLSHGRCQLL